MAYYFAEGSKFYFSQTFAAAKTVTAISNASPAVATSVAHGYVDGDELLFTSGWELANNSIFRADQLTADTFGITGLNSSNTTACLWCAKICRPHWRWEFHTAV